MERKDFLKNGLGFLGMAVAVPSLLKTNKTDFHIDETLDCSVTNSETAGPFPTITPSSLVTSNIVSDRTGVALTINITIKNTNANCVALAGAIVDIWHCDKDGNYSEYGGTAMQATNYTNVHFLRGRQTTDVNGLVSFTSIFPGWYTSRATHIHVHVYNSSGTSLLVTQIAFPEGTNSAVSLVNAATAYGYTKGMTGYTYNANDNVFSDGVTNELSSITGNISNGYVLTHTIFVAGNTLGVGELGTSDYKIGQNYPNPLKENTTIPLNLEYDSKVMLQIFDMNGRLISTPFKNNLLSGENTITLNRKDLQLSSGYYIYKVSVENINGVFVENKKMIVD